MAVLLPEPEPLPLEDPLEELSPDVVAVPEVELEVEVLPALVAVGVDAEAAVGVMDAVLLPPPHPTTIKLEIKTAVAKSRFRTLHLVWDG